MTIDTADRFRGILLGTAVGDALGLPFEGLSRRRAEKLMPGPLRHRFVFGCGLVSDDTEHTMMVTQTLLEESSDASVFVRKFARRLKWWFLALPAGVGMATVKACVKLLFGASPQRSGVFSAGNGPAMRAAVFGPVFKSSEKRRAFLEAATRLTHTDPKALTGAQAIAQVAALAVTKTSDGKPSLEEIINLLKNIEPTDADWMKLVDAMIESWNEIISVQNFAEKLGLSRGVGGYVYQTVPVAVYSWYAHYGDFAQTVESVIRCGGDTDTVAAIAGALAGATVGESGIPVDWINGIRDWPINATKIRETGNRLAELVETGSSPGKMRLFGPEVIFRNVFFLIIVLFHGFRRLAPPY